MLPDASSDAAARELAQKASVQSAPKADTSNSGLPQPWPILQERGVSFTPGDAFYRAESAQGRDLAVLAAAVHRRQVGQLRVLDVMAGSGMRGARYLQQAGADLVWANDFNPGNHDALVWNLVASLPPEDREVEAGSWGPAPGRSSGGGGSSSGGGSDGGDAVSGSDESGSGDGRASSSGSGSSDPVRRQARAWGSAARRWRPEGLRRDVEEWGGGSMRHGAAPSLGLSSSRRSSGPRPASPTDAAGACCRVSHVDASRLLAACYLAEDFFDLVDVDSFGCDSKHLGAAIECVRYGGLLYLTSTDGVGSGGKRPERSLGAYGTYPRPLPWANEQGLRMLLGAAVREGAARGVVLTPLFSLYSFHGPVFRVMLRCSRGRAWPAHHYAFVGHCFAHGGAQTVPWRRLGRARCRCQEEVMLPHGQATPTQGAALAEAARGGCSAASGARPHGALSAAAEANDAAVAAGPGDEGAAGARGEAPVAGAGGGVRPGSAPLALSGPMWTGPLHDEGFLRAMQQEAAARGWAGSGLDAESGERYALRQSKNNGQRPLEELLGLMLEEADASLPPWYLPVSLLAQHLDRTPSRDVLIQALRARGFAATRSHVEVRALRTNASVQQVLQVAVEACGHTRRAAPSA